MVGNERAEGRRSARAKVLLAAELECDGARTPVRVANLSAHGALVLGAPPLPEDKPLIFRCSGLAAGGWMAWVRPPYAGINFHEPVEPADLLPKARSGANLVTRDTRKLDFRRPGFRGNQMNEEERQIVEAWRREQLEKSGVKETAPDE